MCRLTAFRSVGRPGDSGLGRWRWPWEAGLWTPELTGCEASPQSRWGTVGAPLPSTMCRSARGR